MSGALGGSSGFRGRGDFTAHCGPTGLPTARIPLGPYILNVHWLRHHRHTSWLLGAHPGKAGRLRAHRAGRDFLTERFREGDIWTYRRGTGRHRGRAPDGTGVAAAGRGQGVQRGLPPSIAGLGR
jgi:hypothetical protein